MSLLCEIRKEDRIVAGEVVKVGETCLLPNSLALALENKGLVAWASPEAHTEMAKKRQAARKRNAARGMETKGKKGSR